MSIHGLPWEHSPLANLSLSDSRCNNDSCKAFYEGHTASQKAVSYTLQFQYGHWTTWYYLGIIALFTILHASRLWRNRRRTGDSNGFPRLSNVIDRSQAARRYITYRRLRGYFGDRLGLPSCGMAGFLSVTFVLLVAATFAVQPYYRQHRGYGSPPLAVRTGLMAIACTPILVALSGKANVVTLLTGIGHEKLNVIHRYVAWMTFFFSVVHTIPFIVAPLNDGGPAALKAQFYKPGAFEYTGVPPLAMLFGMVVLSVPWIRNRAYETFWHLHVALAVSYIALMFWHAGQEQDSWAYLWATLALLFASVLARVFWYNRAFNVKSSWLQGSYASLQNRPGGMTRISLVAPADFSWRPGQHCYIRLPSLRPWDNHPFTIACAQQSTPDGKIAEPRDLLFLARTRAGFTQALQNVARAQADATAEVWLDGPYGGMRDGVTTKTQQMILVAGGVGITACLPWLQTLSSSMQKEKTAMQNITLVWFIRREDHLTWIQPELEALKQGVLSDRISCRVYITQDKEPIARDQKESSDGKHGKPEVLERASSITLDDFPQMRVQYGRESIAKILSEVLAYDRSIVVGKSLCPALKPLGSRMLTSDAACGPESLKIDASNACAREQLRVLKGQSKEIKFHSETFGW